MDQDRVFSALRKRMDQDAYVHGRCLADPHAPAGSDKELRRLNLPSSVAEFYQSGGLRLRLGPVVVRLSGLPVAHAGSPCPCRPGRSKDG